MIRVGIPRALLYYHFYPLWRNFLLGLGVKVVESGETNREIVRQGLEIAVDETCFPVKVFYGHVRQLAPRVDCLFIPRMVSIQRRAYICPKFLGLPDMVYHTLADLPPILAPTVDLSRGRRGLYRVIGDVSNYFGVGPLVGWAAFAKAWRHWRYWQHLQQQGLLPQEATTVLAGRSHLPGLEPEAIKVAVLGHPYNVYDNYINLNVIQRLKDLGVGVVTPEMLPPRVITAENRRLEKELFWTLGQQVLGAGTHLMGDGRTAGIVHLVSFGCGPDSMVGELVERRAHRGKGFPFLLLTLDEHSGEAGLVTRLEAFVDTLKWRQEA